MAAFARNVLTTSSLSYNILLRSWKGNSSHSVCILNFSKKLFSSTNCVTLTNKTYFYPSICSRNLFHNNSHSKEEEKKVVSLSHKLVEKSGPLQPYLKLIRIHSNTGSWLLFWPFGWSIAFSAAPSALPDFYTLSMFLVMAFIMRGAGCTINDMWDKDIDKMVARTKERPLAVENLSRFDALVYLGGQLGIGCLILLQYNFYTILLSASSLVLAITYPIMKRIIPWPQVILGFAINWGALIGSPAVTGASDWFTCLPLYLAAICWTVVYDTIYAFQDVKDDKSLKLRSTAISFESNPKTWLAGFSSAMLMSLVTCGLVNHQAWPYYCSLSLIATHLVHQIATLDIHHAEDCAKKFSSNQTIGLILFLGIVLGNLFKTQSDSCMSPKDSTAVLLLPG